MEHHDVIIIGGGFAGASTAWWLKRFGTDRVLVLEKEDVPGAHASGKNAGIARQAIRETPVAILAARSVSFIKEPPGGFSDVDLLSPNGGFLVSSRPDDPELEHLRTTALAAGVFTYPISRNELLQNVPILESTPFQSALACPNDGFVDIHALLTAYLKDVRVESGAAVTGFEKKGRRITVVHTDKADYEADRVVIASGAWSALLGDMAGGVHLPLAPRRRHLMHTGRLEWVNPRGPYVWSVDPAIYFRPESGGLLLSPCDESDSEPCTPASDPDAPSWLADRLENSIPRLANLPIARVWSELRCFVPDGCFVIGPDPGVRNLMWVCSLGGHGMTTSAAVGELAAQLLTGRDTAVDPEPFRPGRFG